MTKDRPIAGSCISEAIAYKVLHSTATAIAAMLLCS